MLDSCKIKVSKLLYLGGMGLKVLITRKLPEEAVRLLDSNFDIYMWEKENDPIPYEVLVKEAEDASAIITNVSDSINKELIENSPNLKVISTMAVGYDNIDVNAATKRGIPIGHTPGVLSEAVADLTFSLMVATSRRIVEGMDFIRDGKWKAWGPMLLTGKTLNGATIGIIGMGRIGRAVAKRTAGFDMKVLYHNRSRNVEAEEEFGAIYSSLDDLLTQSDYVVLLAPSTPETYKMIGKNEFAKMKSNAVFINTSRGTNVDEEALYNALKNKEIWAAGLDVFEKEPIDQSHPLLTLDNVILLPHIGSANIETRINMAQLAVKNAICGLRDEKLLHTVNHQVYNKLM